MNIDQNIVEKLTKLLDLKEIDGIDELDSIQDPEVENALIEYLETISFKTKYVDRPDIEGRLLDEKNHILVGAPGAGKTTLLERLIYNQAQRELEKNLVETIPCFLKLSGHEQIVDKLSSEIGLSESLIKEKLEEGLFWIVFDGVDEISDFRNNFSRITDFVKKYRKNEFTISVRREYFENPLYKENFDPLDKLPKLKRFERIDVDPLLPEELNKLLFLRLGDQFSEESKAYIESFLSKLPEITPLLVEMAVEIYRGGGRLIYENEGRWFEEFFKRKLKRECEKVRGLGRDADVLLDNVLIELGKNAIDAGDSFFEKDFVHNVINNKTSDKQSEYYDLLFRAEMLVPTIIEITTGKHVRTEEQTRFYHKTYRDYYVAKSFVGRLTHHELIEKIVAKKDEHESLVILCGIEPQASINDAIILHAFDADKIELSLECLCRTDNHSFKLVSEIASRLIKKSENEPDFKEYHLLKYVKIYGEWICSKELFDYLEDVTHSNIILKIDWEIIKSERLHLGEVPENIKKTFKYMARNEKRASWFYDPKDYFNSLFIPKSKLYNIFSNSQRTQNEYGVKLYYRIKGIENNEQFLDLALDKTFDMIDRVFILSEIDHMDYADTMVERLKENNEFIIPDFELWMWIVVDVVVYLYGNDRTEPDVLLNHYWNESSPNVQLLILFYIPKTNDICFFRRVLDEYRCDNQVDVERIENLSSFHCAGSGNMAFDGGGPIAGDYMLTDFEEDTYSTLMKCVPMQCIVDLRITDCKDELVKYTFSENKKLRTVAEWALRELEKPKT